jgi:hypothetical protein
LGFGRGWPQRKRKIKHRKLVSSVRASLRGGSYRRCRLASLLLRLERSLSRGDLEPLRNGEAVSYRPPGWHKQGRPGAIEVAAGLDLVVVEGVGASRTEVMPWIDSSLWVQSDLDEAERRGIARDGGTEYARNFWHEWIAQEFEFLKRQRPWERATVIVNGTPTQPYDPNTEIMISQAMI